ncbi:Hypothetical protein D9617_2g052690 [Elsinoe fawcettii]|nr:Hypothetical protein D9617_2g052690 [Elsinoe fawcettii]
MSYTGRTLARHGALLNSSRLAPALRTQARMNGTYQPPTPPPSKDNPHRNFWKSFGRPIAKVFLMAMATYQITYFTWLKLESVEERFDKDGEIRRLEAQLHDLTKDKDALKLEKK